MRPIICAVIVMISVSGTALSQNNTSQSPQDARTAAGNTGRQAPVGHRQPTTKSLPPDVLQNEQRAIPGKKTDKKTTICKGC